jgi:hypothetical protein
MRAKNWLLYEALRVIPGVCFMSVGVTPQWARFPCQRTSDLDRIDDRF